ncbi:MAG: hypothetical protein HYU64_07420 [Armatimonadetes bacterium]|nr:hypothetical protein [Armatimonadota bacterium]
MSKRKKHLSRNPALGTASKPFSAGLKWPGRLIMGSCLTLAMFAIISVHHYWFVPHALKKRIEPYGNMVYWKRSWGAQQDIFIIGQEHYNRATGPHGPVDTTAQKTNLPLIQTQIYRIMEALWKEEKVGLAIGEGLPAGEFSLDPTKRGMSPSGVVGTRSGLQRDPYAIRFFEANLKEPAYVVFEMFNPERVLTWGVNDQAELKKHGELNRELFEATARFLPRGRIRQDRYKQWSEVSMRVHDEQDRLNDLRSAITARESLEAPEKLFRKGRIKKANCVIVMGEAHLPVMVQKLRESGKRLNLYCILPRACSTSVTRLDILDGCSIMEMGKRHPQP